MIKKTVSLFAIFCLLVILVPNFAKTDYASTTQPTYKIWVSNKNFYKSPTSRVSEGRVGKNYYEVKEVWFYIKTEIGWKWVQFKDTQTSNFSLQGDELYIKNTSTLRNKVLDTTVKAGVISKEWSQIGRVWYLINTKTQKGNQWITYSNSPNVSEYEPIGGHLFYGPKSLRISYSPEGNPVIKKHLVIPDAQFNNVTLLSHTVDFEFHYDKNNGLKMEKFSEGTRGNSKDLAVMPGDYIKVINNEQYTEGFIIKVINMTDNYADVEIRGYSF